MKEASARVVTATEARTRLGELMRDIAERRQAVVVERGGKAQIVILSVAEYRRLKQLASARPQWQDLVRKSRDRIHSELKGQSLPASEDILRRDREERDGADSGLH